MRPSSAAALRSAAAVLTEELAACPDPGQVAQQLFAACDTLADNPKLVAALTDATRALDQRRQLVATVFASAHPQTLAALGALLAHSWPGPEDLPGVVDRLGVRALVAQAVAGRGAERLEQQLFALGEAVDANPRLRRVLADRSQSLPRQRCQLIQDVFAQEVDANTLQLATRAVMRAGSLPLASKLRDYRHQIAEAVGAKVATVRSADGLQADQLERLGRSLERIYGCRMIINVATDPDLVGGMRVSVGSDVYDGTLRTALVDARRALA